MLERIRNRRLIMKYPWLCLYNVFTKEPPEDKYASTWLDQLPSAWRESFGKYLVKDLHKASGGDLFIQEMRMRKGQLFIVATSSQDINDVVHKYECISAHTCWNCGKPDVPMLHTGNKRPWCTSCYTDFRGDLMLYEEVYDKDDVRIPDRLVIQELEFPWEEPKAHEVDIKDTVDKIRKDWRKRHGL